MSWKRVNIEDKVVIRDYLVRNYEYLSDGRIRHKGREKARKAVLVKRYYRIVLRIKGRLFTVFYHQAVWIVCHGDFPKGEIDHIDGDRLNNHIENLRDAAAGRTCGTNCCPGARTRKRMCLECILSAAFMSPCMYSSS